MSTTTITTSGALPNLAAGEDIVISGPGVTVTATASTLAGSNIVTAENGATFLDNEAGGLLLASETFVAGPDGTLAFGSSASGGLLLSGDKFEFGGLGSTIAFDSGVSTSTANALLGQVSGFAVGDSFDFLGQSVGRVSVVQNAGLFGIGASTALEFVNAAGTTIASYTLPTVNSSLTASDFSVAPDSSHTGMAATYIACYCRGTRIATASGEVPVENLAIGDLVVTASGALRPIRWIGHRRYGAAFVAGRRHILPIRIAPGALGDGVPARELRVSPEHALHIDGVLIPARHLVNGATIREAEAEGELAYYHVELDSHDILLAEETPAESYVEDGDRGMFQNALAWRARHGTAAPPAVYCAERLTHGPRLEAIRQRLDLRAGRHAHYTSDPGLHLLVDGTPLHPSAVDGANYRFDLTAPARQLVLQSRTGSAEGADTRCLGVAISTLRCNGTLVDLTQLTAPGWHGVEGEGARFWRWTDGAAELPAENVVRVELSLCGQVQYRDHVAAESVAA